MNDDPYRPCEYPLCEAIDSTHCELIIAERPRDRTIERAFERGCRVARFRMANAAQGDGENA